MAHSIKDGMHMRNVLATLRVDLIARDIINSWGDDTPIPDVVRHIGNMSVVSKIWEVLIFAAARRRLLIRQDYECLIAHCSTLTGHPRRLTRSQFEEIAAGNRRDVQNLWTSAAETPYLHILWVHMGLMCEVTRHFYFHFTQHLQTYPYLALISLQSAEKLNHLLVQVLNRATNWGKPALFISLSSCMFFDQLSVFISVSPCSPHPLLGPTPARNLTIVVIL